jgi:predicted  nucleic acid-binding Zn-ribbon protein
MSNADSGEVSVVVERGGVSVEKSFEPDDFPVPAIAFVIHSDRDETTNVRIVDQVPDDVPAQDIGFHPKYGADFWSVEDGEIVFEREFEAGEEYTTVYGLRAKDTDEVERFLTEPTIEGVDGEERVSDIIGDEGADEADADQADGDEADQEEVDTSIDLDDPTGADDEAGTAEADAEGAEETAGPKPAEASADDLESAIADIDGTGDGDEEGGESVAGGAGEVSAAVQSAGKGSEAAGNGATTGADPEDLAAALATEIRDGEVADEDLETLRDALGADLEPSSGEVPGHVAAKIDKLQSDVDEVVAYTGALESFLDDGGSADELLAMREEFDGLRASVADLEGRVDGMDDRVDEVAATADALEGSIGALHDDVADLESGLSDLEAQLADLEDDLGENLSSRVADLEGELDAMEDDIQTLDNLRQALSGD